MNATKVAPRLPGAAMLRAIVTTAAIAVATLPAVTPASAQLPSASVRSLGLSGNDTAVARGFGAVSANPAGLAMPDSGFSLAMIPVGVSADLGPVGLERLQELVGSSADSAEADSVEKLAELADDLTEQGARIRVRADATALALTVGNMVEQISVGLQAAVVGSIAMDVAATDTVRVDGDGYVATIYGLSVARPLPVLMDHLDTVAIGATAKYGTVHVAGVAQGSAERSADAEGDRSFDRVRLDAIWSGIDDPAGIIGSGFGLDVGVMARRDPWAFGASVQSLPATFAWDEAKLSYVRVSPDDGDSDLGERPFDEAPADLQTKLPHPFGPSARIGAAYRALDNLTLSGDVHYRFGDSLAAWPPWHAGVGVEYRPVDVVELRAGVSFITDAVQLGGGASLMLGPYSLSVAMAVTTTGGVGAQIGLLSFGSQ